MKKGIILVSVVSLIVIAGVVAILYNLGKSKPSEAIGEDTPYEWIVAPKFDYERVFYDLQCDRFLTFVIDDSEILDSNTGEISNEEHYGHGSGGGIVVYDQQLKKWGSLSYDSGWVAILPTITKARDYTCENYSRYLEFTDIFPVYSITILENGTLSPEDNREYLELDGIDMEYIGVRYKVNEKYAYATNDGFITEFVYDDIDDYVNTTKPAVKQGDKWGFINKTGALIIPCEFDDALSIDDERAFVKQNGRWGIIRKEK